MGTNASHGVAKAPLAEIQILVVIVLPSTVRST
jgi:hypothetical protein